MSDEGAVPLSWAPLGWAPLGWAPLGWPPLWSGAALVDATLVGPFAFGHERRPNA